MHRTQLYLDDSLWTTLKNLAKQEGTTVSDLVRVAARERYVNQLSPPTIAAKTSERLTRDRSEFNEIDAYVRDMTTNRRDERLLATLGAVAHQQGTTVAELVRATVRDKFTNEVEERLEALKAFIGIRADRPEFDDVDAYIRNLRRGDRRREMLAE